MNQVKSPLQAALLLACTVAALPASAEHREHGAHVHGVAQINVVLDSKTLAIDLGSPAANLVGFEHAARNEAEKAALKQAVAQLRDANAIFTLPQAAQCKVETVEVESALLKHDHEHEHNHDEAHEAHAHHAHDADEGEEGHAHADMEVSYRFHCAKPQALDGITVNLFKLFPATEELEVQQITPNGQGAAELTADAPYLRF